MASEMKSHHLLFLCPFTGRMVPFCGYSYLFFSTCFVPCLLSYGCNQLHNWIYSVEVLRDERLLLYHGSLPAWFAGYGWVFHFVGLEGWCVQLMHWTHNAEIWIMTLDKFHFLDALSLVGKPQWIHHTNTASVFVLVIDSSSHKWNRI